MLLHKNIEILNEIAKKPTFLDLNSGTQNFGQPRVWLVSLCPILTAPILGFSRYSIYKAEGLRWLAFMVQNKAGCTSRVYLSNGRGWVLHSQNVWNFPLEKWLQGQPGTLSIQFFAQPAMYNYLMWYPCRNSNSSTQQLISTVNTLKNLFQM